MRSIAYRRHKEECKKKWAAKTHYLRGGRTPNPVMIGIIAHTPAMCSCSSCGNPRNHFGNSKLSHTISELRKIDEARFDS